MEVKFLVSEKNEVEVEMPGLTLPEILRVYLLKDSDVTFAAWKRDHYTSSPVLKVKTKTKDAKVAVKVAVRAIVSDLEQIETQFKALK